MKEIILVILDWNPSLISILILSNGLWIMLFNHEPCNEKRISIFSFSFSFSSSLICFTVIFFAISLGHLFYMLLFRDYSVFPSFCLLFTGSALYAIKVNYLTRGKLSFHFIPTDEPSESE